MAERGAVHGAGWKAARCPLRYGDRPDGGTGRKALGSITLRSPRSSSETDPVRYAWVDNIPSSNSGANEAFCHPLD